MAGVFVSPYFLNIERETEKLFKNQQTLHPFKRKVAILSRRTNDVDSCGLMLISGEAFLAGAEQSLPARTSGA
jgi:hypothetical protein